MRYNNFKLQEFFSPTNKVKDLLRIIELFGELEEEKVYPEGMVICIMGNPVYVYKYHMYYIHNGLYIISIESLKGELFTMAFLDKKKLDKSFFTEENSLQLTEEGLDFLFDFDSIREILRKGEDNKNFEMEKYACPLEIVYLLLSNYLIFLYEVLCFNFLQLQEAYDSDSLDKIPFIDISVARNINYEEFSYEELESFAKKEDIKNYHSKIVGNIGQLALKNKRSTKPLKEDDKFILKNPIKGVYGLVNKGLLNEEDENSVHFIEEDDANDLLKKWSPQYVESIWKISKRDSYLRKIDNFVYQILIYRSLLNTEYSLACMGKAYNGKELSRKETRKVKRKIKKALNF